MSATTTLDETSRRLLALASTAPSWMSPETRAVRDALVAAVIRARTEEVAR